MNVIEDLIQKYGRRCSICGKEFTPDSIPNIEHIIPYSMGGSNNLNNLQLVCDKCNSIKDNKFISHEIFIDYIEKIIKNSPKYQIVKDKFECTDVDLVIKDKDVYKICEIKVISTFTKTRIDRIIEFLKKKEKYYIKRYKNVKSILIFPGEISEKNIKLIKDNNIEIWDREYLKKEFKKEIAELNNIYLNNMLGLQYDKTDYFIDEYEKEIDIKIKKLKSCDAGINNWSNYQKLIGEIIEMLFCPPLEKTITEKYDFLKVNRRDFIMPNYVLEGFWSFIREKYYADYIVIDAKNSATGVNKENILQMANYLKKSGTGLFGIIIARKCNEKKMKTILRDIWIIQNKMIIVLNDDDIEQMLIEKKNKRQPELIIRQKIEDFRISI